MQLQFHLALSRVLRLCRGNGRFPYTGMTGGGPARIAASANGRQGVFLRLRSLTARASRTASLAFCSSESGGAKWAS